MSPMYWTWRRHSTAQPRRRPRSWLASVVSIAMAAGLLAGIAGCRRDNNPSPKGDTGSSSSETGRDNSPRRDGAGSTSAVGDGTGEGRGDGTLASDGEGVSSAGSPSSGSGSSGSGSAAAPYVDVAKDWGIVFQFETGRSAGEFAILESLGGGVAAFDFDLDRWTDLAFAGGGRLDNQTVSARPCALFRNLGPNEANSEQAGGASPRFTEIASLAGCTGQKYYNHGIFPADFDNDGFPDLAISGYGGVQLLHNQGDGTFVEWKGPDLGASPLNGGLQWSTSLAWGDLDGDGDLDLYVPQYVDWSWDNHPRCTIRQDAHREVCPPKEFSGLDDMIWRNEGDGRFTIVGPEAGLRAGGKGLGAVVGDVDGDGDMDIYVANDTTNNFLYRNDGTGHFEERGIIAGVAGDDAGVNTGSMGVVLEDLNHDGRPDLWVTNFERELFAFYRNDGQNLFSFLSRTAGLADLGGLYVGFGTVLVDYDGDGDRDIVVANGHVSYRPAQGSYPQPALLLEQVGNQRFQRRRVGGYFQEQHTGRGVATADLDNDGVAELVFSHCEEPVAVLKNQRLRASGVRAESVTTETAAARWATVDLVGRDSNRDALGATIRYESAGRVYYYQRCGGGSYLSHSDRRFRLFVPEDYNELTVAVRWPSGREQSLPFPAADQATVWLEPVP